MAATGQDLLEHGVLETNALLDTQARRHHHVTPSWSSRHRMFGLWCGQLLFFLASLSMLLASLALRYDHGHNPYGFTYVSNHSPAEEAVRDTDHMQRFEGDFGASGKYKGSPSIDIDAAWDEITYSNGGIIRISQETLEAVNASAEYTVEFSEENGGGYMGSVEVLHQLHCLNMLRKATYEDYYRTRAGEWTDSPETLRRHMDHCVDILRQKLMCDADTNILTYVWVKGHKSPYPDFSVQHSCRNFWAVTDWMKRHQLYLPKGHVVERVKGAKELEHPP